MSDDLVAFIEARLRGDQEAAEAIDVPDWRAASSWMRELIEPLPSQKRLYDGRFPLITEEDVEHIARHDPARVLREVAAHRRLLADIVAQQHWLNDRYYRGCSAFAEALHPDLPDLPTGRPCSCGRDADVERRLRLLAAIWSDSPGFRTEWLIEENTDG